MKRRRSLPRSHQRILTTHTGSLPRPATLLPMLYAREKGEVKDQVAFDARLKAAVAEVVKQQIDAGIDVINDGEAGKITYATYVKDRLTGFGGEGRLGGERGMMLPDMQEFPELAERMRGRSAVQEVKAPACDGPITYKGMDQLQADIDNLKAATAGRNPDTVFMSAASPGVISGFLGNHYYRTPQEYVAALADAMKTEYEAIHKAGFILQLDCPDLAMSRHIWFNTMSLEEFRKRIGLHVELLNQAVAAIPPERMRMHLCWGNYEGPHHHDVALADIIDIVLKARPAAISVEAANPRHEHEWKVFEKVKLPAGKMIIPGVVDSTNNFVEHPELIAQRLGNWASVVRGENLMAGTDCGFATIAGGSPVHPGVVWLKFRAMAEGARLASEQ